MKNPAHAAGITMRIDGRSWMLIGLSAAAVAGATLVPPIAQPLDYHTFVDQRTICGVPNFWNVVSNLPFLLFGLLGLAEVSRRESLPLRPLYFTFFGGACLVAFGSGYYHLAPSNETLVWDRLTMAVVFMAFFAIVVAEYVHERAGRALFIPLEIMGIGSVVYWHFTEVAGHGDLRAYGITQFLPAILIPLILILFPARMSPSRFMWGVLATYVLAKLLEYFDAAVYSLGHVISGHSLKHVAAALGTYLVLLALKRRYAAE